MDDLVVINRPVQDVFAFVTDHSNDKYWKPFVTESIRITPDPLAVGTRFKITTTAWRYRRSGEVEILDYKPYHSFTYRGNDRLFPFVGQLFFSETPEGTALHGQVEFQAQGIWKLFSLFLLLFFRSQSKRTFTHLKYVMEGQGKGS